MSFTLPIDVENRPVAVIGAGTLGRRIALMFATCGGEVRIHDRSAAAGAAAVAYVGDNVAQVAAKVDGGRPARSSVTDDMAEAGHLGVKTGQGFYDYRGQEG